MRWKRVFHVPGPRRDVDEELAFHFESRIEELIHDGLSSDEARRRALSEFGDVSTVRHELLSSARRRAARRSRIEALRDLAGDAEHVARSVARAPGFAVMVALTLGLGIGAAATMYGVVDRLLLRGPEHVVDPGSLRRAYAHVRTKASGEFTTAFISYSAYTALRDHARSVAEAAAYSSGEQRVGTGPNAVPAQVAAVTADFFPLLGAHAAIGRFFTAAEDAPPDGVRVAVLDHGYWLREFGGSTSALGKTIVLNDQPFTIIGVTPEGFTGAELRPIDIWIPVSTGMHPTKDWPTTWRAQWLNVIVRLKPNETTKQVDDDLTATFRASYAGTDSSWHHADLSARNIAFTWKGEERPEASIARWLTAVALLVLLIASANVANLLIVRSLKRRHEIAVRLALGIGRARLARLLLLESLAYTALGSAAAVLMAYAGGETMRRVFLSSILWTASPVSSRVVAVLIAIALVVGGLIGLAQLPQVFAADVAATLRGSATSPGLRSSNIRRLLLVTQTALCVTLLVGAGLFIRSLSNVRHLDLGVEPDRVLVASVGWPTAQTTGADAAAAAKARDNATWRELRDRMAHLPGVSHAALAVGTPFGFGFGTDVSVPGRDTLPDAPGGGPYVSAVGADYFATAGTPLLRGRAFTSADGATSPRVAIVNETMARLIWPNEDALGKCIIIENSGCSTIVGVVRDARRSAIRELPSMQYYIPLGQEKQFGGTKLLVRPVGDARAFVQTLRRAITQAKPDANYLSVRSMQDSVDPQIRPWRLGAVMFGLFAAVALIVAAVGLYSVIAYNTAQRTHEFGVRLAIGASGGRLVGGVLLDGVRVASIGVVFGALVALVAAARIAPLLFNVSPRDPAVFVVVIALLLLTATLASLVPAWRAARLDPTIALRA